MLHDAGLVTLAPTDYGKPMPAFRGNLRTRIFRTPHAVRREPSPEHVSNWGPIIIASNGVAGFDGGFEDAIAALEKAGPRGAAALGGLAGLIFASSKIFGVVAGAALGYFGGQYAVNFAKKLLLAQQAVSTVAKVVKE